MQSFMKKLGLLIFLLPGTLLAFDFDDGVFAGSIHTLHRPSGPGFKIDISWSNPDSMTYKQATDKRQTLLDQAMTHLEQWLAVENWCSDGYFLDEEPRAANDQLVVLLGYCVKQFQD